MTIKAKKTTGPEAIRARIMGLDTKTMGKMDVGEFMLLREGADADGRKKLDYLLRRMEIENFARGVVREELAKRDAAASLAVRTIGDTLRHVDMKAGEREALTTAAEGLRRGLRRDGTAKGRK